MEIKQKPVQPKTGKNHRLFGVRYLKQHNMRDPNWTTDDKFSQYVGLTLLHGNKMFVNLNTIIVE